MATHEILAVIGARSGSKGVPNKNIKLLHGKPLMAWIIEAAKKAKTITRVIVSTENEAYAEIARRYGAETPFLRPQEFAQDLSTDYQYVRHALEWLEEHEGYKPDLVARLFPTTPLTQPEAIDATVQLLIDDPEATSSKLMAESTQTPYKMYVPGPDPRYLTPLLPQPTDADVAPVPRQLLPKAYVRGNMIVSRRATIMDKKSLFGEKMRFHVVPQQEAVDIDHEYDFLIAEALLKQRYEDHSL